MGTTRVITFVTQFDDAATRRAGATPSGASSSSSCCCCCIATAVGASVLSGIHVRSVRRYEHGAPPDEVRTRRSYLSMWPEALGFLALAVAIGVVWLGGSLGAWAVLGGILVWWLLLYVAYRGANDETSAQHALLIVILAALVAFVEAIVWAAILT
jgi:hypothetical protein